MSVSSLSSPPNGDASMPSQSSSSSVAKPADKTVKSDPHLSNSEQLQKSDTSDDDKISIAVVKDDEDGASSSVSNAKNSPENLKKLNDSEEMRVFQNSVSPTEVPPELSGELGNLILKG
ncbi:MAG: hypothetical protein LBG86_01945 [Puniceicoccales bacterium]|jgi:hypothetical protein|nr:hypothetical protein [Puniceicoccales bacterium]